MKLRTDQQQYSSGKRLKSLVHTIQWRQNFKPWWGRLAVVPFPNWSFVNSIIVIKEQNTELLIEKEFWERISHCGVSFGDGRINSPDRTTQLSSRCTWPSQWCSEIQTTDSTEASCSNDHSDKPSCPHSASISAPTRTGIAAKPRPCVLLTEDKLGAAD